jgi:hypothetical protein
MKIEVWKSEHTGKIFELEADYKKHMRRENASIKRENVRSDKLAEIDKWLMNEKDTIVSIDMIAPWFLKNQHALMKAYMFVHPNAWDKLYDTDEYTSLNIEAQYSRNVSNSHRCPKNGVTNWGNRDKAKPSGYPGFSGRVTGVLKRQKKTSEYPTSDFLTWIGINTGAGGGGNENWAFGVEIFLDDWPGLSQSRVIDIIKGVK